MSESGSSVGAVPDTYTKAIELACEADVARKTEHARKTEDGRQTDKMHFDKLLDDLVKTIAEGYEAKVMEAAGSGKRLVDLFVFDGADKYGDTDHSLLFLIKGPRRHGQDFFLRLGILPFMARMWQVVRPFDVDMVYDPEANENTIILRW